MWEGAHPYFVKRYTHKKFNHKKMENGILRFEWLSELHLRTNKVPTMNSENGRILLGRASVFIKNLDPIIQKVLQKRFSEFSEATCLQIFNRGKLFDKWLHVKQHSIHLKYNHYSVNGRIELFFSFGLENYCIVRVYKRVRTNSTLPLQNSCSLVELTSRLLVILWDMKNQSIK